MTVQLTTEREQRIQATIHSGVQEVVDAAIAAVEQRAVPGFDGTEAELETFLLAGMESPEVPEDEFWGSVDHATGAMLAEHQTRVHP